MAKGGDKGFLKEMAGALRNLDKNTKSGGRETKVGLRMGLRKLDNLIGVTKAGQKSFVEALSLQELAITRGTQLGGLLQQSADNISNLEEGFTGYAMAVGVAADAFDAGLNTNNQAIGRLLLSNKLTEKGSKLLAKTLRANTIGLGINDEGMTRLANTTLALQQMYGLTTQELQSAISALGERLQEFAVLGIAEDAEIAAMVLGSAVEKGGEKMGAQLLAAATAADKMGQMSALGVQKEREKFLSGQGDNVKNATELMFAIMRESKKIEESWVKDGKTRQIMQKAANDTFGGVFTKSIVMQKALIEKHGEQYEEKIMADILAAQKQMEINKDFTKTWDNVKEQIVGPLKKMLVNFVNKLIKWSEDPLFVDMVRWLGVLAVGLGVFKIFMPFLTPLKLIAGGLMKVSVQITLWIIALMKQTFMQKVDPMKGLGHLKGTAIDKFKKGAQVAPPKALFSGIKNILMGALRFIPKLLITAFIGIPVFGLILIAIAGIVKLVIAYKKEIFEFFKPLFQFFKPVYDFFVHGIWKIKQAFKTGFWDGITAIGKFLINIPLTLIKMQWKNLVFLMSYIENLWYGSYFEDLYADIVASDQAIADAERKEREKVANDAKDLKDLQLRNEKATEAARLQKAQDEANKKLGSVGELLKRINAAMDVEALRLAYSTELQELQVKAAQDLEAKASGGTPSPTQTFNLYPGATDFSVR